MFDDDEILHVTFCGTNLTDNEAGCCYHSVRTDDGVTIYVWWRIPQWHL